jgi:multidrug resistance efflux pump
VALAQAQLERVVNGAREQERSEARALYTAKMAEMEGARLNWQRSQGLVKENAISQQEADDLRTRLEGLNAEVLAAKFRMELLEAPPRRDELAMAQARVAAARARLELASYELERTRLRAPQDCRILDIDVEEGELTGPTAARPVVILADTSRFRVRAFVEELDALALSVGMRARVTADALDGRSFEGQLVQLSPQMGRKQLWNNDPAERYDTKTREIWIDLEENQGGLIIGLPVDVAVDTLSNAGTSSCATPNDSEM